MNNSFDHIRSHQVNPHERTWRSVKEKLNRRKSQQKVSFYRNLSIAAGLIAILAIVLGFSSQLSLYNGNLFTSNDLFRPDFLEDLPMIHNDYFYSYDKILEIEEVEFDAFKESANPLIPRQ